MFLFGCWLVDYIEDVGVFVFKNVWVKCYEFCFVLIWIIGKLFRKVWKKRRLNKSVDWVFVFDIMCLNIVKLISRELVYMLFGKLWEMDSILKILYFKWWEFI